MSTVTAPRPAAPVAVLRPPRRRRWVRLVAPFAVVLVLVAGSAIAYSVQQPDQSDPGYLSPTGRAATGGARLADLARQRGVTVERATRSSDALVSAFRGNATLLIPAPALVHPYYLRMLKLMPASTRVVLVAPSDGTLALARLPAGVAGQRWAARVESPGCAMAAPRAAGRAAARRLVFTAPDQDRPARLLHRCYGGGLVELRWHATSLTLVGADDAFRNDRIGEHGNAALATGLVTANRRLVWLDVHRLEPRPGLNPNAGSGPAPPSLAPGGSGGSPDPDFPVPGAPPPGQEGDEGDPGGAGGDQADGGGSPLSVFPPVAWAVVALLLAAGVLLALAQARRLGAPVREPLPVTVPAAETVLGRGRLYQRARARGPALSAVLAAARERLLRLLDLPADTPTGTLVAAAADRSGWTVDQVSAALRPPEPDNDELLVTAVTNLSNLVRAVARTDEGEQR